METQFNREEFDVRSIPFSEAKEWVLKKHYAHRIPSICYAFGLYRDHCLCAVCTYGVPASQDLIVGSMGIEYKNNFLELNRLVANDGLPKNALSYFVAGSLKLLPRPMVVVSYADSGMGHHGYIYQATNWIYTGMSDKHITYVVEGMEGKHDRHLGDGAEKVGRGRSKYHALVQLYGDRVRMEERSRKYRYFQFLGDKRQVRQMRKDLKYSILGTYPKGDNSRYDASYQTHSTGVLF